MDNIDIARLVEDIKSAERSQRKGEWGAWIGTRRIDARRYTEPWRHFMTYETHVTSLYTLRAFLRGRMHRKNMPAPLRDCRRSMTEEVRLKQPEWSMEDHNRSVAEEVAERYQREEVAA